MRTKIFVSAVISAAFLLGSCSDSTKERETETKAAVAPTNRIEVPTDVQQNLGITWAKARLGRLEHRISIPGEIVARTGHNWTISAPLSGTVKMVAERWKPVKSGEIVAEIISPELADIQADLYSAKERAEQARTALRQARAQLEPQKSLALTLDRAAGDARGAVARVQAELETAKLVSEKSEARLEEVARLKKTDAVSSGAVLTAQREGLELTRKVNEAERALRTARTEAAEQVLRAAMAKATSEDASRQLMLLATRFAAAEAAFQQRLAALATACGLSSKMLSDVTDEVPGWARLRSLALRAPADGVVVDVQSSAGIWVDRNDALLEILDPKLLTFRALIPEADVVRIPMSAAIRIEAPGFEPSTETGQVSIRPVAHAPTRSVLLESAVENPNGHLRVGMSANGLVTTSTSKSEEVLIPLLCVVRDGLQSVIFRRDPADPNQVVRVVVTLGESSGGWTEVIAGAGDGDELVQAGVHQLKQTGLGKAAGGGHFHADGTFHEGDK